MVTAGFARANELYVAFQIALDFVPHLIDRDPLDGRRQFFEDVLRLDSGPFGNGAEYGQAEIDDILFYFVIYFVIPAFFLALRFGRRTKKKFSDDSKAGFSLQEAYASLILGMPVPKFSI